MNPVASPFRKICKICSKTDIIFSASKEFYCNICRAKKLAIKSAFICATINTISAEQVFVNIVENGLKQLNINWQLSFLHIHGLCKPKCWKTFVFVEYSHYLQRLILLILNKKKKTCLAMNWLLNILKLWATLISINHNQQSQRWIWKSLIYNWLQGWIWKLHL
jgi:ribosome-associated toxin RatA of RatAB toxin-antitoxin module